MAGLTTNFGLSPLFGKPLALISDARLGPRADASVAGERLLSISGEDTLTIDRKFRDPWTGRLPTRFLILTNELPRFSDSSGAVASRFIIAVLQRSFYGQEDPTLTEQLLAEAPGIFNWVHAGLDRLQARGHFEQPAASREALRHLEDMASPHGAFVQDACEPGPLFEVEKEELWVAWKAWCAQEGQDRPGTKAVFIRDLRAAVPGLHERRLRRDGETRLRVLAGLKLRPEWSASQPIPAHVHEQTENGGEPLPSQAKAEQGGPEWARVGSIAEIPLEPSSQPSRWLFDGEGRRLSDAERAARFDRLHPPPGEQQ